jgi:hypothetical protein
MTQRRPATDVSCTRSIAEQWVDWSGIARSVDHTAVTRIELLDDPALEALRSRHPRAAAKALEENDELLTALEQRADELERIREGIEGQGRGRPFLTTIVCTACGAFASVMAWRPWNVDRAMKRTSLAERDVLEVERALRDAYHGTGKVVPELDALSGDQILSIRRKARRDAAPVEIREVVSTPSSGTRLTRREMAEAMKHLSKKNG